MPRTMPSLLLDARARLGESPLWHPQEQRLYWVDIDGHNIHRTDPATGIDEVIQVGGPIGCIARRRRGGLIAAMQDGCAIIESWGAAPVPFGPQILSGVPEQRFNDGSVDPAGRWWIGSRTSDKSHPAATLYRLDLDASLSPILSGLLTSNGAAFSPDGRIFYHADTPTHAVRAYDVDPATGALGPGRLLHQFADGTGRPDGGAVDVEGCYWSALYEGGRIVRLSPTGEILRTIVLPVRYPTMIAFGGPDMRTAFITSASPDPAEPLAGGLFSIRVDVPGQPITAFAG